MPKPQTVSRLCIKCHSKTVHEVRERTVAGTRIVCTDCGNSLIVSSTWICCCNISSRSPLVTKELFVVICSVSSLCLFVILHLTIPLEILANNDYYAHLVEVSVIIFAIFLFDIKALFYTSSLRQLLWDLSVNSYNNRILGDSIPLQNTLKYESCLNATKIIKKFLSQVAYGNSKAGVGHNKSKIKYAQCSKEQKNSITFANPSRRQAVY